jgi:DNA invertase Pin-like site-specific DNA recombinase
MAAPNTTTNKPSQKSRRRDRTARSRDSGIDDLFEYRNLGAAAALVKDIVKPNAAVVIAASTKQKTPSGRKAAVPLFVAYYRVSTDRQGVSGLGLEAQREAVGRHIALAGGALAAEFQEIESGSRKDRPELSAALAACRAHRATLIIAKLDRLARNVSFISNLMESGVDFVATDHPLANRLTVHILAAVAENESEMISRRTKEALAQAKLRGVKLGNPNLKPGSRGAALYASRTKRDYANAKARDIMPYIDAARRAGCLSLGQLAEALTARGIRTPAGKATWSAEQVRRVLRRIAKE